MVHFVWKERSTSSNNLDMLNPVASRNELMMKLVVIGDSGVGKTSLIGRFIRDEFWKEHKPTTAASFENVLVQEDVELGEGGEVVAIQIWDTPSAKHSAIKEVCYKGAAAAIIVYDVTDESTIESVPGWLGEVRVWAGSDTLVALVGTKTDKLGLGSSDVSRLAQRLADCESLMHFQVSAQDPLSGENDIEFALDHVIAECYYAKHRADSNLVCSAPSTPRNTRSNASTFMGLGGDLASRRSGYHTDGTNTPRSVYSSYGEYSLDSDDDSVGSYEESMKSIVADDWIDWTSYLARPANGTDLKNDPVTTAGALCSPF